MSWRTSGNGDEIKPDIVEKVAPNTYFLRKDFKLVDTKDIDGEIIGKHWEYLEKRISETELEQYLQLQNTTNMAEKSQAIVDYNIIMGNIDDPTEV